MRLNRQGDKTCYSETGCSFARHFAILSRNVGILIGSLLRAKLRAQISTCCLVVFVCSGGSKSGMFQVLLQYFEDRYASFYVQKPITDFTELLERVKKAVPVLKGTPDDQIRISYNMVGHLFQNYDTIYVRFFLTYTCNHSCYTICVRFFVTYTCVLFPSI